MEIKDFNPNDETKILELFNLVFGKPMSIAYWLWRFQNNPSGKHFIKLMWDNDVLTGHYAVSPVLMDINGENKLTTLSMTTMTHPNYGGKGIFKDLALSLYNQIETEKNVVNIWGYPNSNSHYGFIKNLGWKDLSVVHSIAMTTEKLKPEQSAYVNLIEDFDESHYQKIKTVSKDFKVKIDRNVAYLNWRYVNNPSNTYQIFNFNSDSEFGFIVTKLYPSPYTPNTWEIFIMELGIENSAVLPELFSHIMAHYNKPISRINIWISLWDKRHIQLEKMGFIPFGKQTFLGARFDSDKNPEIGDFRNWYYSYGDSDVY